MSHISIMSDKLKYQLSKNFNHIYVDNDNNIDFFGYM